MAAHVSLSRPLSFCLATLLALPCGHLSGKPTMPPDATRTAQTKNQVTLICFHAPWCQPCRQMQPVIEALAIENAGRVRVDRVNIDKNKDLVKQYQIKAIPTMIILKNNKETHRKLGTTSKQQLQSLLDTVID